jgi:hypothetical protein
MAHFHEISRLLVGILTTTVINHSHHSHPLTAPTDDFSPGQMRSGSKLAQCQATANNEILTESFCIAMLLTCLRISFNASIAYSCET